MDITASFSSFLTFLRLTLKNFFSLVSSQRFWSFHVICSVGSNGWKKEGTDYIERYMLSVRLEQRRFSVSFKCTTHKAKAASQKRCRFFSTKPKAEAKKIGFHGLWNVVSSSYIFFYILWVSSSCFFSDLMKYLAVHIQERTKITWEHMKVWRNKKKVQVLMHLRLCCGLLGFYERGRLLLYFFRQAFFFWLLKKCEARKGGLHDAYRRERDENENDRW